MRAARAKASRNGRARRGLSGLAAAGLAALACSLAAPVVAEARELVYGVVPQNGALPPGADLDRMPRAGISSMRTMLPWGGVESTPGEYDWSVVDTIVRETTDRGIEPLFFIYGTPEWAARIDKRDCSGGDCAVFPPRSAATRRAFGDFAAAAARRYGPGGDFWTAPAERTDPCELLDPLCADPTAPSASATAQTEAPGEAPCGCTVPEPIVVWQIWNEQNSPKYFAPKVDPRKYAALLHSAAAGIRSVDPDAEVMLGGMWGPRSAEGIVTPTTDYLDSLYRLGARRDFDSVAVHPYAASARGSLAQMRSVRRALRSHGDRGTGVWVSEIGWAGSGPRDEPYVKGLSGQARTLSRALGELRRRARSFNLRGVFWYSWRDLAGGSLLCAWCGHAGLLTRQGAPKPAWHAFRRIASR